MGRKAARQPGGEIVDVSFVLSTNDRNFAASSPTSSASLRAGHLRVDKARNDSSSHQFENDYLISHMSGDRAGCRACAA